MSTKSCPECNNKVFTASKKCTCGYFFYLKQASRKTTGNMEAKMVKNGGMIVVDDDGDINNGLDKSIGEYDGELRMKVVTKDSLTLAKVKKAPRTTSMTVGVCRRLEFDFSDPNINYEYQAADETEGDGKQKFTRSKLSRFKKFKSTTKNKRLSGRRRPLTLGSKFGLSSPDMARRRRIEALDLSVPKINWEMVEEVEAAISDDDDGDTDIENEMASAMEISGRGRRRGRYKRKKYGEQPTRRSSRLVAIAGDKDIMLTVSEEKQQEFRVELAEINARWIRTSWRPPL